MEECRELKCNHDGNMYVWTSCAEYLEWLNLKKHFLYMNMLKPSMMLIFVTIYNFHHLGLTNNLV